MFVAHLAAVAVTRVRIPASCQILYIVQYCIQYNIITVYTLYSIHYSIQYCAVKTLLAPGLKKILKKRHKTSLQKKKNRLQVVFFYQIVLWVKGGCFPETSSKQDILINSQDCYLMCTFVRFDVFSHKFPYKYKK